jgi:ribonuclease VapC
LILDSSAVVAVIREEKGRDRLIERIEAASEVAIGAPTAFECVIVLVRRYGVVGRLMLARFLQQNRVITVPFEERHWDIAADAYSRYGKGRHPARLNYGDCMTYATAKVAGLPLLFVGEDFAQTDVAVA